MLARRIEKPPGPKSGGLGFFQNLTRVKSSRILFNSYELGNVLLHVGQDDDGDSAVLDDDIDVVGVGSDTVSQSAVGGQDALHCGSSDGVSLGIGQRTIVSDNIGLDIVSHGEAAGISLDNAVGQLLGDLNVSDGIGVLGSVGGALVSKDLGLCPVSTVGRCVCGNVDYGLIGSCSAAVVVAAAIVFVTAIARSEHCNNKNHSEQHADDFGFHFFLLFISAYRGFLHINNII